MLEKAGRRPSTRYGGNGARRPGLAEAQELYDARSARRLLNASATFHDLTIEEAYVVQSRLTELRVAAGRRIVGYKLGYTSSAMRTQMGVPSPNHGPIFDDMFVHPSDSPQRFVQPRVEPEVGLVLGGDLDPHSPVLTTLADTVAEVRLCLEVVDSVWRGYHFTAAQNTADGSSAAGLVVGPVLDIDPLECHRVVVGLHQDGYLVNSATAAAGGHPLYGLGWLSRDLARRGASLSQGDIVITGGLTPAYSLSPGSTVTAATVDGRATVSYATAELP